MDSLADNVAGSGPDTPLEETRMSDSPSQVTVSTAGLSAAWDALRTAVVPLASYIGAITALAGTDHIGTTLRAIQGAISGLVIAVDHHNLTK